MIIARLKPREDNGKKFLQGVLTADYRFKSGTTVTLHKRSETVYELVEWAPRNEGAFDRQATLSFTDDIEVKEPTKTKRKGRKNV